MEQSVIIGHNKTQSVIIRNLPFSAAVALPKNNSQIKFKQMEKVFKNDTIMGFIALATFALVAYSFYKDFKAQKELGGE